jgi:hypothetical protein
MSAHVQIDALLCRLADALDCPVEAFIRGTEAEASPTQELLRLWVTIPEVQSRQRILAMIRQELERQTAALSGPDA